MVSEINGTQIEPSRTLGKATAFAQREQERLRRKHARYEEIGRAREVFAKRNRYYGGQVQLLVKTLVMPGTRVLEVGCGLGDLIADLHGSKVCGIDFSAEAIRIARRRHPGLDLQVADVERDPLPAGPFDVVILSDVLGHFDDVQHAMERIRTVLAPGGRIVVTYYNFVWEPILRFAERIGWKTPYPLQNWLSMDDITNLLGLAGFEVIRRGTDVLLPIHVPLAAEVANRVVTKL